METITDVEAATDRLRATVASMDDADLVEPSLLPDWSRAHVLAHLALNAAAMTRVFGGLTRGDQLTVYDSVEARDSDIEEWAALPTAELRDRFTASLAGWEPAAEAVPVDQWKIAIERTPGGRATPADDLLLARRREVEIHHCDLGAGYSPDDWPADFGLALLEHVTPDRADGPGMLLVAADLGVEWRIGSGGDVPKVTGSVGRLAWWLVGRGDGKGLSCDAGPLPTIGAWR